MIMGRTIFVLFCLIHVFVGIESSVLDDDEDFGPTITYEESGNIYYGEVKNAYSSASSAYKSVPHGRGTMLDANSVKIYDGMFSEGERHGLGALFYRNGSKYEGHFEYGVESGYGKLTGPDGVATEGYFKNGKLLGYIKVNYPSGSIRKGYWSNNSWIGRVDFVEHRDGTTWNEVWNGNSFAPDIKLIKISISGEIEIKCKVHHDSTRSFDISIVDKGQHLDVVKEIREEITEGVTKLSSGDASNVMCVASDYSTTPETVLKKQMNNLNKNSCGTSFLQEMDFCNSSGSELTKGCKSNHGAVPWQALLYTEVIDPTRNQKYGSLCGGVIIEDWLILTAAHCVKPSTLNRAFLPSELTVKVGYRDRANSDNYGFDYEVENIKIHANFINEEGKAMINDIALIALKKNMAFGNFISAICLPKGDLNFHDKKLLFSGYGRSGPQNSPSDLLRIAEIVHNDMQACADSICSSLLDFEGHFCAGGLQEAAIFKSPLADSCDGDSGGPLTIMDNDQHYLIGILSQGPRSCGREPGAVFTKVHYYLDWIKHTKLELMAEELRGTSTVPVSKMDDVLLEEILEQHLRNVEPWQTSIESPTVDICNNKNKGQGSFNLIFVVGSCFYSSQHKTQILDLSGEMRTCANISDFPMSHGSVSTYIDNKMLVCGGKYPSSHKNKCYSYEPQMNQWKETSMIRKRTYAQSILLDQESWWVTGDSSRYGTTTELYSSSSGSFKKYVPLPVSRSCHNLVRIDESNIMLLGDVFPTNQVFMFNQETLDWTQMPDTLLSRDQPMAGFVKFSNGSKFVVLAGGARENSTEFFSLETQTWQMGPTLPYDQLNGCVAQTDETFYILGGYYHGRKDILKFDLETEDWIILEEKLKYQTYYGTCTWVPDDFVTCI